MFVSFHSSIIQFLPHYVSFWNKLEWCPLLFVTLLTKSVLCGSIAASIESSGSGIVRALHSNTSIFRSLASLVICKDSLFAIFWPSEKYINHLFLCTFTSLACGWPVPQVSCHTWWSHHMGCVCSRSKSFSLHSHSFSPLLWIVWVCLYAFD